MMTFTMQMSSPVGCSASRNGFPSRRVAAQQKDNMVWQIMVFESINLATDLYARD
jgi:hypothetical protein